MIYPASQTEAKFSCDNFASLRGVNSRLQVMFACRKNGGFITCALIENICTKIAISYVYISKDKNYGKGKAIVEMSETYPAPFIYSRFKN
ncbi:MAG: hypothetical protein A2Y00_06095 [Omnitrophica WOR_2 bacterium GWF2_43_52]|nr:MAG: hypothetical protein A2Y00_06095 [Omnitrophica WOR_2 bacterium GWF2_43_52]OGX58413.1 MAG: hypothetical protein A2460_06965 [Omnitrophica WOR_2 bacterium RIFOXYC2_FULL_43_9]HAH20227.1 hypothetical protein [Candidatus Omnitrophota bacterium]HBG63369.1 hypothetical protein [Candidatus Omnitrophota bacterium]